jgi:F0F1-type ATP synthase membrane subunit b/b'
MKHVFIPRMTAVFAKRESIVSDDLEQSRKMAATSQSLKKKYNDEVEDKKMQARQIREEEIQKLELLRSEEIAKIRGELLEKMKKLEKSKLFEAHIDDRFQDILLGTRGSVG